MLRKILSLLALPIALHAQTADPYSLDTTFGTQGVATFPQISGINPFGMAPAFALEQNDGKLLFLERASLSFPTTVKLVRALPSGQVDNSTGLNGVAALNLNEGIDYNSLYQVRNGFVIGGVRLGSSSSELRVMQLDNSLGLDPGFGSGGHASYSISTFTTLPSSMVLTANQRIIIGASAMPGTAAVQNIPTHVRLLPSGNPDPSYGVGGKVTAPFAVIITPPAGQPLNCRANTMMMQSDGKLLVAGTVSTDMGDRVFLARYQDDGTLDSMFATDGLLIIQPDFGSIVSDVRKILLDGNENIYLVFNEITSSRTYIAATKYSPFGVRQLNYGNAGLMRVAPSFTFDYPNYLGLAMDFSARLYVGGTMDTGSARHFALLRYDSHGQPDTAFAPNGRVEVARDSSDICNHLLLQADSGVILSGYSLAGSVPTPVVMRFKRASATPASVTTPTGKSDLGLALYPNPNEGTFTCTLSLPKAERVNLSVVNALGQQVWEKTLEATPNSRVQIALPSTLVSGNYFVQAQTAGGILTKPVILMR